MYAIIAVAWHQRLVHEQQEIVVDALAQEVGTSIDITDVLVLFDDTQESVVVWTPYVPSARVQCTVRSHTQGEKMHIVKIQNKKRYRRKIGFRPQQTVLFVDKILA